MHDVAELNEDQALIADAIVPLVKNIVNTRYEDILIEARDVAKRCVIDTVGAMVAGSTAPGCKSIVDMIKGWGGKKESTIMVYGGRVTCPNAAWANGTMARARDFDDCDEPTGEHPSVATVTTALAVAELLGKVSGKEIITAITLGADLVIRIRDACKLKPGFSPWGTGTYSVFPSAAVAGKLLGLDEEKMIDAMGLSFCQMSNTQQGNLEGSLSIRVHHGIGVRAGILAALMADKGITGPRNVLEGKFGLYPAYEQDQYDRDVLLSELGEKWLITRISVKPYPCCKCTHGAISGVLYLVQVNDIHPDDIGEIVVYGNKVLCEDFCQPEVKRKPKSVPAAQFSIPYTVGAAVVHRDVTLDNFTEESIRDARVLRVASKVRGVVDPELAAMKTAVIPTAVEIQTLDGRVYSTRVEYVKGHPENPMSLEECIEKFRKCVAYSAVPLPSRNIEEVINRVRELEKVDSVAEIARLLT